MSDVKFANKDWYKYYKEYHGYTLPSLMEEWDRVTKLLKVICCKEVNDNVK